MAQATQFGKIRLEYTGSVLNIKRDGTTLLQVDGTSGSFTSVSAGTSAVTGASSLGGTVTFGAGEIKPYVILSGDQPITGSYSTVLCISEGSTATVTLPASPVDGQVYCIKSIDESGQIIRIDSNGRDIEGAGSFDLPSAGDSVIIQYCLNSFVGGSWKILASYSL